MLSTVTFEVTWSAELFESVELSSRDGVAMADCLVVTLGHS